MQIFQLPSSYKQQDLLSILGPAVNFGPEGVKFSKPVSISLPVDPSMDMGNRQFAALRFNPTSKLWEEIAIDTSKPPAVPGDKLVYALTSSFSVYASAAQTMQAAAASSSKTPEGSKLNRGAIIGGVVGGFCGFILLLSIASYVLKEKMQEVPLVIEPVKGSVQLAYSSESTPAEPRNEHGVPLLQAPNISMGLPVVPGGSAAAAATGDAASEATGARPMQYAGFA